MFVVGIENSNPKTGLKPSSHNWLLPTHYTSLTKEPPRCREGGEAKITTILWVVIMAAEVGLAAGLRFLMMRGALSLVH